MKSVYEPTLRYGSVCSGIEAPSVAWHPLGWKPVFFSDIERFPSRVLAHHYPDVTNLGDMTRIDGAAWRGKLDVLIGGTPCQAFSVAGKRESLADDRGNLSLIFCELVHAIDPLCVVWENVPGVLSTKDNAFGCFLAGLVGESSGPFVSRSGTWPVAGMVIGPRRTACWRVLDAQYFGLAQRRRRVFVVSFRTRDRINPAAVLLEPESVPRHLAPSREAGAGVAGTFAAGIGAGCDVARALTSSHTATGRLDPNETTFVAYSIQERAVSENLNAGPQGAGWNEDKAYTLEARHHVQAVAYRTSGNSGVMEQGDKTASLGTHTDKTEQIVHTAYGVRRLTPRECERLQGFPDRYTDIPGAKDGPRYKALGNSMAVPVIRWIGRRVEMVVKAHAPRKVGAA